MLNARQFHRLITHEDRRFYHAHKIFGFAVLSHFIYRTWNWYVHGHLGFHNDPYLPVWLIPHFVLHLTSFEFHLSNRRNTTYNIIWPEMRWHSMFFAYRSLFVMLVHYLNWQWLRGPIVFLTMIAADLVTLYYKNEKTTMRGNPYPSYVPDYFIIAHNLFYSISQIFATMNMLFRGYDLAFLALIPIQTAPFCMTLVKKGIITQMGWHIYYTLALLINYYYAMCDGIHVTPFKILVLFLIIGRFYIKANKYLLWSVPVAYHLYLLTSHRDWYMNIVGV